MCFHVPDDESSDVSDRKQEVAPADVPGPLTFGQPGEFTEKWVEQIESELHAERRQIMRQSLMIVAVALLVGVVVGLAAFFIIRSATPPPPAEVMKDATTLCSCGDKCKCGPGVCPACPAAKPTRAQVVNLP